MLHTISKCVGTPLNVVNLSLTFYRSNSLPETGEVDVCFVSVSGERKFSSLAIKNRKLVLPKLLQDDPLWGCECSVDAFMHESRLYLKSLEALSEAPKDFEVGQVVKYHGSFGVFLLRIDKMAVVRRNAKVIEQVPLDDVVHCPASEPLSGFSKFFEGRSQVFRTKRMSDGELGTITDMGTRILFNPYDGDDDLREEIEDLSDYGVICSVEVVI